MLWLSSLAPRYKVFYITVVVLVLIIEISGGVYLLRKETIRWQDVILIGVVGACLRCHPRLPGGCVPSSDNTDSVHKKLRWCPSPKGTLEVYGTV